MIGFIPHVVTLYDGCLIALQPDFGSIAILAALTWAMLFAGGVRLLHLRSLVPFLPVMYIHELLTTEYRDSKASGIPGNIIQTKDTR